MKFLVNPASALCATKNLSVLLIIGLAVLSGCRDTHQIEPQDTNFNLTTPHVENGYLVFDDYKAFLRLLKSPENVSTILVENWQKIDGFTSLQETYNNKRDELLQEGGALVLNLKQPKTQDIISLPATSLLGKVVNEKGIVLVGKNLLFFSRQYTKVLTDFKGSLNEIDKLVNATQASETSGLYVKRNEIYSTEISSANARKYNSFNQYNYGNTILLLTTNGGSVGYATGYVRGYVDGVRNNYPTDFCPNPDGSTYVCGWEYSYSVTTHADFYLNDYGVVSGYTYGIQITWTTDRGNGSGYGSASICSSGSGAYGISGVTPFSDIEGTVNFSFGVNNAGYPTYSNASISL